MWQVIAVLDYDILRQLVGGAEYHKERCEEAVAGRGVVDRVPRAAALLHARRPRPCPPPSSTPAAL
eukprot:5519552-Prymnesium_polylepis.1